MEHPPSQSLENNDTPKWSINLDLDENIKTEEENLEEITKSIKTWETLLSINLKMLDILEDQLDQAIRSNEWLDSMILKHSWEHEDLVDLETQRTSDEDIEKLKKDIKNIQDDIEDLKQEITDDILYKSKSGMYIDEFKRLKELMTATVLHIEPTELN